MKKEAESVRDLGGLAIRKFADGRFLEFEELRIGMLSDLLGEAAQMFDRLERLCSTLLLHNRPQACGEESYFLAQCLVHDSSGVGCQVFGTPHHPTPSADGLMKAPSQATLSPKGARAFS